MTFKIKSQSVGAIFSATPTMAWVVSSNLNDNNGISGNGYIFSGVNPTLAGNCLVLMIAYPYSATRTISVSDSRGDTWPAAAITQGTASSGNMNVAIFVLPNASAGVHTLTVTFDGAIKPFQYTLSEWYNVSISSPADGTVGANSVSGSSANCGSFTPSTNNDPFGGHLIISYAISNDIVGTLLANQASAMSATNSAKLLHANNGCTIPSVSAYSVQTANGAINPGFSITQSSATNFVCAAVALKAAIAGTAPAAGIRIVRIMHTCVEHPQTSNTFLFPCDGNLRVVGMAPGSDLNVVTGVSDSASVSYTNPGAASQPQVFYAQNVTPSNSLTVTMGLNSGEIQFSVKFFDIVGAQASSFINASGIYTAAPSSGAVCNDLPDHTPTSAPGLTICITGFGTGPTNGFASGAPAGAIYDLVYYTGMTDADQMDNADGFGHFYYSTTATQTWNWGIDAAAHGSTAFATAVSFK